MSSSLRDLLDGDGLLLTDCGLETAAIFRAGIDLPEFAAHTMLVHDEGKR